MSYQVIARKYRPQRFEDVVGQEHVTQTLSHAIQESRIAHAYLFCGPRGTGKTTLARIFAKCLNCTDGPKIDFAEDDPRCAEIAEGRSLDVLEIDGASNRGIDEIRELRETVKYSPATSPFKIYIVDEVHMLTKEAFNALLKTLEEPPAHAKFMFATTEPEKVLPTILSRCQRFDLRRIPSALIVKHLTHIAQLEKVGVDDAALHAIARGADGGMRDAESTLDQLISFCGDTIREEDVLSMFGLASRDQVVGLAASIIGGDTSKLLQELENLTHAGKEIGRLLSDLQNYFRNLLVYLISKGDLSLMEASEAEAVSFKEQGAQITPEGLTQILEVLTECESRLRETSSKRIAMELALIRAVEARNAMPLESVLQQLSKLRGETKPGGASREKTDPPVSKPRPTKAAVSPPKAAKAPSVPNTASTTETQVAHRATAVRDAPSAAAMDLDAIWSDLVEAVGTMSLFTQSYLKEAHPVGLAGSVLTIGFPPESADHLDLVDNQKNRTLLKERLTELGHAGLEVKFVKSAAPARSPVRTPAAAPQSTKPPAPKKIPQKTESKAEVPDRGPRVPIDPQEFRNDPLIKEALEIFRGQIVEVRS